MKRKVFGSMCCRGLFLVFFSLLLFTFFTTPAFAVGGLQTTKVAGISTGVTTFLRAISLGIVTPTIIWNGYGVMYGSKTIKDCLPIVFGCLIISGATEIAILLLS